MTTTRKLLEQLSEAIATRKLLQQLSKSIFDAEIADSIPHALLVEIDEHLNSVPYPTRDDGHCHCGTALRVFPEDDIPLEFCSEKCSLYLPDLNEQVAGWMRLTSTVDIHDEAERLGGEDRLVAEFAALVKWRLNGAY